MVETKVHDLAQIDSISQIGRLGERIVAEQAIRVERSSPERVLPEWPVGPDRGYDHKC